jgi:hypothetical protein
MFTTRQVGLFVVLGIVFWFSGAMLVRIGGPKVFTEGNPLLVVLYILTLPISLGFIAIARALSGVPLRDMLVPSAIMTAVALLLDGVAVGFFSQLYGSTPDWVMHGAGLILWGGGVGLVCAAWFSRATLMKPSHDRAL